MLNGITPEILACLLTVNFIKLIVSNQFKIYFFYPFRTINIEDALDIFLFLRIITKKFVDLNKGHIAVCCVLPDYKIRFAGWPP